MSANSAKLESKYGTIIVLSIEDDFGVVLVDVVPRFRFYPANSLGNRLPKELEMCSELLLAATYDRGQSKFQKRR